MNIKKYLGLLTAALFIALTSFATASTSTESQARAAKLADAQATVAAYAATAHEGDIVPMEALTAELTVHALTANPDSRFVNLSTRCQVGTGENVAIGGMAVSGNGQKQVLLRAIGPALSKFGISNPVKSTQLEIYNSANVLVRTIVGWDTNSADAAAVKAANTATGAFPLDAGSKDSAVVVFLFSGNYTFFLKSADGSTGVGMIEIYEL